MATGWSGPKLCYINCRTRGRTPSQPRRVNPTQHAHRLTGRQPGTVIFILAFAAASSFHHHHHHHHHHHPLVSFYISFYFHLFFSATIPWRRRPFQTDFGRHRLFISFPFLFILFYLFFHDNNKNHDPRAQLEEERNSDNHMEIGQVQGRTRKRNMSAVINNIGTCATHACMRRSNKPKGSAQMKWRGVPPPSFPTFSSSSLPCRAQKSGFAYS
ncbi:hypothetical protein BC939DRAFT_452955 [Gamsiella multidivaricata]|uniref:uncharacterized protein n=1 Tax=Gamsiella multidivaricata TaxID=101098 RepID=UPI00222118FB|nr:uncharacterized protein BC939DRAFT_452955 [Gamsiella multidivaricata]KAI7822904.1 hypothetical protein BC939DRAFT_452955 [Gamsiella multidivaricata]